MKLWLLFALSAGAQLPLRPAGLVADSHGNLFYADAARNQVFESSAAGTLTVIAGTGEQGYFGDNGLATAALLNAPQALALGSDGTLYIADTGNNRVRAISTTGIITTVVSALHAPGALALDSAGSLYIADTAGHQILRLKGTSLTVAAGTGEEGFYGDSGPATAALLDSPSGLAVLPDGRILIADTHNHRLRAIALDGTITTIAGTGTRGYSGDNGSAASATLALPRGLATLSDGTILLADSDNHRVRSISPTGIITTIAGDGIQGSPADGAAASASVLDTPGNVAVNPYNAPVFTDHLLRAILSQSLYAAATETSRTTTLSFATTGTTATLSAQGSAATPQGTVTITEAGNTLASALLSNGSASIPLSLSPGAHTLTATYSGDAFNPAASVTTPVSISLTPTVTTFTQPSLTYAGLPLALAATVTPSAAAGTVTFKDSGVPVASATVINGTATAIYLAPVAGSHVLLASYSGNSSYAPSSSATMTATVNPMPDFTLTVLNPAQTATNGVTLVYTLSLAASPAPFTGAIALSASGLQANTAITFAPAQVVPGSGSATATMSIPTANLLAHNDVLPTAFLATLLLIPLFRKNRRRALVLCSLILLSGCGTRVAPESSQSAAARSYTVTVTGTATNLAGAVITHSAPVTLTVQ